MIYKENFPISKFISFKVGGPANIYIPENVNEFKEIITLLNKPIVIGDGTNTIFPDKKITQSIIINKYCGFLEKEDNIIHVYSSVKLANFLDFCVINQIGGYEFLSGIPGTIGGAIRGNAGAFGKDIGEFIVNCTVFNPETKKIYTIKNKNLKFSYRNSLIKQEKLIVISVKMKMTYNSKHYLIKAKIRNTLLYRKKKLPTLPSAGSFFKNIETNNKRLPAAKLIEDCGLKGLKIGGIMVSKKHANFLVNFNNGTYNDIITLKNIIISKVKEKFGITLIPEVQIF